VTRPCFVQSTDLICYLQERKFLAIAILMSFNLMWTIQGGPWVLRVKPILYQYYITRPSFQPILY